MRSMLVAMIASMFSLYPTDSAVFTDDLVYCFTMTVYNRTMDSITTLTAIVVFLGAVFPHLSR